MKLAALLGNNHPYFALTMQKLEQASGNTGVDVALLGEITHAAHTVMRRLQLDPTDTTAQELYNTLNSTVRSEAFDVFEGAEYTLLSIDNELISFNVHDCVENMHHELSFDDRHMGHAQRRLRMEIVKRYAEHDRTDNEIVKHLASAADIHITDDHDYPVISAQPTKPKGDSAMPTILAIGDIFTDAFITLGDDTAKIIKEGDTEWLAVPFGRKPPYQKVDIVKSVGPSPNVAVSIARLGYNASLMAWIGGDKTGEEAIEHLKHENVGTESMVVESDKATSYWYVLCYKADRTMLVKSEKYAYQWTDPATKPEWIYLAYTGEDSWPLHEGLLDYLKRNPDVKFALQPGTFQFKWGTEKMSELYKHSYMTLMNREEAMDVTGLPHDSVKDLADGLHKLGPAIVVITDGPNGSFVSHDGTLLTIPNYPDPKPPVERTGAGDAFSSTFVAAVAAGETIETALTWAPINSASVVQHVGAQKGLLSKAELEEWLSRAPEDYYPREVSE